jgi:hypothetical protein
VDEEEVAGQQVSIAHVTLACSDALYSRPTTLDKFTETGWRWIFYFCANTLSAWALWEKPWVWNTFYCWYGYPFHPVDPAVWWHYMLEMAFYWSLTLTQFSDVKRKVNMPSGYQELQISSYYSAGLLGDVYPPYRHPCSAHP